MTAGPSLITETEQRLPILEEESQNLELGPSSSTAPPTAPAVAEITIPTESNEPEKSLAIPEATIAVSNLGPDLRTNPLDNSQDEAKKIAHCKALAQYVEFKGTVPQIGALVTYSPLQAWNSAEWPVLWGDTVAEMLRIKGAPENSMNELKKGLLKMNRMKMKALVNSQSSVYNVARAHHDSYIAITTNGPYGPMTNKLGTKDLKLLSLSREYNPVLERIRDEYKSRAVPFEMERNHHYLLQGRDRAKIFELIDSTIGKNVYKVKNYSLGLLMFSCWMGSKIPLMKKDPLAFEKVRYQMSNQIVLNRRRLKDRIRILLSQGCKDNSIRAWATVNDLASWKNNLDIEDCRDPQKLEEALCRTQLEVPFKDGAAGLVG